MTRASALAYLCDREIRLLGRASHHRILLALGELLNPARDEGIEARRRDKPLAEQVGLAERDSFDDRLGEGTVAPVVAFDRHLPAGRGGIDDDAAVLRGGHGVDENIDVDAGAPSGSSRVAGVEEPEHLAGYFLERTAHFVLRHTLGAHVVLGGV